jgi:hypothetical protein
LRRDAVLSRIAVTVRIDALFDRPTGIAHQIVLNTGDHSWTAVFDRVDDDPTGFRSWVGRLEGIAESHVVFTERNGVVSGLINALGAIYQVRTTNTGNHLLERIDVSQLPDERDPVVAPDAMSPLTSSPRAAAAAQDAGDTVDVLILYTPAARSRLGATASIQALAAQVISDTNSAFSRSGVRPRVRLVGSFELALVESAQITADLPALRASPEARFLRDAYRADLVQLLVSSPDQAACGVGYLLTSPPVDFEPYSVADVACAAQYTPTHEMGHNFGSHHAPDDGASGALFPYSYAFKDPARGFRTVMAYSCAGALCPRIPNFSNPSVTNNGAPTGTESQNNARSINEAAFTVANFRESLPGSGPTAPTAPVGLRSTVVGNTVTVAWDEVLSNSRLPTAVSYILQVGSAPGAANLFNVSVGSLTTASGVVPVGTYYWRVIATNSAGASPPSADAQFVVGECRGPGVPEHFTFSVSARTVALAWNAASTGNAPSTYVVEAGSGPTLANLLSTPVGAVTSVVTTAPPGTYYVRVRAQNACGTSAPSNEQVIVVP